MSGAERMKRARALASLFLEKLAASRRTDAERKHVSRVDESPAPADTAVPGDDSDTDSNESDCSEANRLKDEILSSVRHSGVEDEAAVKQLQALRARQFAPKCKCSVLGLLQEAKLL